MQTFQIAQKLPLNGAEAAVIVQRVRAALTRVGASMMAMLKVRRDDAVAARYQGCSWADQTERQMTGEIVDWGCTRF